MFLKTYLLIIVNILSPIDSVKLVKSSWSSHDARNQKGLGHLFGFMYCSNFSHSGLWSDLRGAKWHASIEVYEYSVKLLVQISSLPCELRTIEASIH